VAEAFLKAGSIRGAAAVLGVESSNIRRSIAALERRASLAGYHPASDDNKPVAPGFVVRGTSKLYKHGEAEPALTWVKTRQEDADRLALLQDALGDMLTGYRGIAGIAPAVPTRTDAALLNVYPVGDVHLGMLAWGKECGEDWNTSKALAHVAETMAALVASAPAAERGLIAVLGDYFHVDNATNRTPASGHTLDVDSRVGKIASVGTQLLRTLVDLALAKHDHVELWVRPGNHDPTMALMLSAAFSAIYANDPRVIVSQEPGILDVTLHGRCLLAATHGHTMAPRRVLEIVAARYRQLWGDAKHVHVYSGHVHHDRSEDFPGGTVEAVRIIPPKDAFAASNGYEAARGMHADTWHKDRGRISRITRTI
jgi:hypothetical protein